MKWDRFAAAAAPNAGVWLHNLDYHIPCISSCFLASQEEEGEAEGKQRETEVVGAAAAQCMRFSIF